MRTASDVDGLLAKFVRYGASWPSELLAAVAGVDADRLLEAAEHHGVLTLVHPVLSRAGALSPHSEARLDAAFRRHLHRHLRALGDLAEVSPVLDGLSVRWVVVKGPVLAEAVYPPGELRSFVDLDVVVPRRDLSEVIDALQRAGSTVTTGEWARMGAESSGQVNLVLPHGTPLDLHWHLFNRPWVRQAFSVSMDELLGRARRVQVSGIAVPTLDPADTLVHVSAHAALSGGGRLVWYRDLAEIVARDRPDWEVVVERARSNGLSLVLATMLARARRVIGAEVPPAVLDRLAPALGWRSLVALVDRASPPYRSSGRRLTAQPLVVSTRQTTSASGRELLRLLKTRFAGGRAGGRVRRGRGRSAEGHLERGQVLGLVPGSPSSR